MILFLFNDLWTTPPGERMLSSSCGAARRSRPDVSDRQFEAAHALGLRSGPTLRLVIIPQALRVIIPPLTSQYLNLTKNSSLAVAIAYPDLVAIFAGTALNQTGQAVEIPDR